jgi:adenine-specific DNA-methyltransferase
MTGKHELSGSNKPNSRNTLTELAMSTTDKNRIRLINLLKELFQLDQPELDFGFYKIMHAKSVQITKFLESDLLKEIEQAFGQVDVHRAAEAKAKYEEAIEQAKKFGAPNPEETEGVKEAKSAYENAKDSGNAESEIYDHLYRFFERYYDSGDFMSRRYYARESDSRAAPYSVPYDGREVYLHWANKDQYYIKSSEYLSNYTFELNAAIRQEAQKNKGAGLEAFATLDDEQPLKVHFRIIDASEGEHGNIKAANDQKRFFLIHEDAPIVMDNGELVIQFHYRTDAEKTGQDSKWQEKLLEQAELAILKALKADSSATGFLQGLSRLAPTDSKAKRTLLGKYLYQYAARYTMDYFIHKDLGGFMRRELDFYIKNEIMRLDDIENAEAPKVEQYLAQIRVLRRIAKQLIAFLSQLEDFQKKLWLKKKFVTETNYCITLDRVPEKFYAEIAANDKQLDEWEKLFAISEINDSAANQKCTPEFLKNNPFLLLDTALFSDDFKQQLLAELPDLDAQCDGVLIHSENFQALGLMQKKYREQVKCIYIDPPYNTVHSEILYKNQYKHSSWLSLINNCIPRSKALLQEEFSFGLAIDDYEFVNVSSFLEGEFYNFERSNIVVNHHPQGSGGRLSRSHEYYIIYSPSDAPSLLGRPKDDGIEDRSFMRSGTASNNYRKGRWRSFYALLLDTNSHKIIGAEEPVGLEQAYPVGKNQEGFERIYPINSKGEERVWRSSYETGKKRAENGELTITDGGTIYQTIEHQGKREVLFSNWTDSQFNAGTQGTAVLTNLGLGGQFDYPNRLKHLKLVFGHKHLVTQML